MPRGSSWQLQTRLYARACPQHSMAGEPAHGTIPRAGTRVGSLRQCEHRESSAERGIIAQRCVTTDGAEAGSRIGQTGCEADTGPTADAGEHGHVLSAALLIGRDVTDDSGRGLEL